MPFTNMQTKKFNSFSILRYDPKRNLGSGKCAISTCDQHYLARMVTAHERLNAASSALYQIHRHIMAFHMSGHFVPNYVPCTCSDQKCVHFVPSRKNAIFRKIERSNSNSRVPTLLKGSTRSPIIVSHHRLEEAACRFCENRLHGVHLSPIRGFTECTVYRNRHF